MIMGRHKEWRKIAKKMRRKRIRRKLAEMREELKREGEEDCRVLKFVEKQRITPFLKSITILKEEKLKKSPSYAAKLQEEAILQLALEEAERKEHKELQKKWEEEEKRVREETEMRKALLRDLERIKEEQRIKKEEEMKRKIQAEKEKTEKMAEYIYQFSLGQRCGLPAEMLIPSETQPGKEVCPFFSKVAACRFWDTCSRNHVRPALSDTILFPGFYSHFTMSQIGQDEYDTDMSLEYDDKETYSHFLEFYRDIRYEFEACGRLTRLVVCCNSEAHLRGNVYISYASEREAMAAYLKFNGRFYAGKQVYCHFVTIPSWKSAICGLFFRKKCPKGDACNFMHIFRDPGPPFYEPPQNDYSPDVWRWSESPEQEVRHDASFKEKKKRKERKRERSRSSERRRGSQSNERERSRSPDKRRRSQSKERGRSRSPKKRRRSQSKERQRSRSPKKRWRSQSKERQRSRSPERRKSQLKERRRSRSSERRRSELNDKRRIRPSERRHRSASKMKIRNRISERRKGKETK